MRLHRNGRQDVTTSLISLIINGHGGEGPPSMPLLLSATKSWMPTFVGIAGWSTPAGQRQMRRVQYGKKVCSSPMIILTLSGQ